MNPLTGAKMVVYGAVLLMALSVGAVMGAQNLVEGSASVQAVQILGVIAAVGSAAYIPIGFMLIAYVKKEQAKRPQKKAA